MREFFIGQLEALLNQTITVYTENNQPNHKLQGVLIAVGEDYITLVLSVGQSTPPPSSCINFTKRFPTNTPNMLIPGIIANIPISKITSIIHYAI